MLPQLSIGQKLASAALGLLIWALPAAGVWLYMRGQASAQYELGAADARAECAKHQAAALAEAIERAREEWQRTQTALDRRAEQDAARIEQTLAAARRQAAQISEELSRHVADHPLPVECRADADRVRLYNDARSGHAPEG
jgi:hypothetical protein